MPEGWGGARTPQNPAPVSGPGRLARRTDGGPSQTTVPMTGMAYGENADYNDMQSSAPLAATPSVSNTRARKTSPTGPSVAATPLFAPTARPDEPVTAGAPFGPGEGPAPSAVMTPARPAISDTLDKVLAFTNDQSVAAIIDTLRRRGL